MANNRLFRIWEHLNSPATEVVVVGGVARDVIAMLNTSDVDNSKTPGKVVVSHGGVGRNIAENLVRMGLRAFLISAVGKDADGKSVKHHLRSLRSQLAEGVCEVPDARTATFVGVMQNGEQTVGVSDFVLFDTHPTATWIDNFQKHFSANNVIVVDTNLPIESLQHVCKLAYKNKCRTLLEPVSTTKCKKPVAAGILQYLSVITPNELEVVHLHNEILAMKQAQRSDTNSHVAVGCINVKDTPTEDELVRCCATILTEGVQVVVVTRGSQPVLACTKPDNVQKIAGKPPRIVQEAVQDQEPQTTTTTISGKEVVCIHVPVIKAKVVSTVGAGDAFLAGFVWGLSKGYHLVPSLQCGVYSASICIQSPQSVSQKPLLLGR
eukprot:TRINITY_DN58192_c0_g1_i1.p1 TRINITY_DN58192_c0_g1~~TRINITY_DN58192_c0_g1_i1.p1  ORF type:complete len:379 (-),score=12.29 TRINITY_DN58192_c0_g1_i1:812-1948(-)